MAAFARAVLFALPILSLLAACQDKSTSHAQAKARLLPPLQTVSLPPVKRDPPPPSRVVLEPISMAALPGWRQDKVRNALPALRKTCTRVAKLKPHQNIGKTTLGGQAQDWFAACRALQSVQNGDEVTARQTLVRYFDAFAVGGKGTFTGYYEPLIYASTTRQPGYTTPLLRKPSSAKQWMKQKGSGPSRWQIEQASATQNNAYGEPFMWINDPVEAFMLHIQGSGLVRLTDGRTIRVSYEGDNGHRFKSVFPAMMAAGYDSKRGKSIQAMTKWLKEVPGIAGSVMAANPRYIYFKPHYADGAEGAQGVTLTAGRSMAVDPAHIPLGVPLWLDTQAYYRGKMVPVQRLMVSQDVGNAIKGVVRGDVFWGTGPSAMEIAGRMKEKGRYYIFLPRVRDFTMR